MISVNTNVTSLIAQRALRFNQAQLNLSLERLSTGLRINRASDDPAGLIASENLRSQKAGVQAALDNAARAGNVAATADGGLTEVSTLLNQLQGLVTQSANDGGLSREERAANQLQADSILATIDRITNSTNFAGRPLLNGAFDYNTANLAPNTLTGLAINRTAGLAPSPAAPITVAVQVLTSARTAALTYLGGPVGAGGATIELAGLDGSQQLSFASGATLTAVAAAVRAVRAATGVSASVVAGTLQLSSTAYGSRAFVAVRNVAGTFATSAPKAAGRDASVTVNGTAATTTGNAVSLNAAGLDLSFTLDTALNKTNASASFQITGGGATFSLGPQVTANGLATIGLPSTSTASLGTAAAEAAGGALASLRSGGANSLLSGSLVTAQKILNASIKQVSYARARLGAFIKFEVGSTVRSLQTQLENLTAAESQIRDTDFAAETANLTRYQILSQAAQSVLAIANQQPNLALTLLNNIRR